MHQKDLVKQAWESAGLYSRRDAKLQQFLKHVDESPTACWPELIDLCRTRYPEYLEQLVTPIWNTGDRLLRLNLIRAIDLERQDEQALFTKLVRQSDLQHDEPELRAIIQVANRPVLDRMMRRRSLPQELKTLVELRRARLTP
jgi:hypothetical protein